MISVAFSPQLKKLLRLLTTVEKRLVARRAQSSKARSITVQAGLGKLSINGAQKRRAETTR
jgi:hypothetical protein